jgi:hypothetical protein
MNTYNIYIQIKTDEEYIEHLLTKYLNAEKIIMQLR